jgi:hypothetical protein
MLTIDAASTAGACTISGNLVSFTGVGTCIIDGNAAANADYLAPAQIQQTIAIGRLVSNVTLQSSPNPSALGQQVTFTVTVGVSKPLPADLSRPAASGATSLAQALPGAVPSGTVMLRDDATVLVTLSLNNGSTSFSTSLLAQGTHTITAVYSGDAVNAPASATLFQTVAPTAPVVSAPLLERWAMLLLAGLIGAAVFRHTRRA